jgi:ribosome-binding protein aMBF1 (putative translation factor)
VAALETAREDAPPGPGRIGERPSQNLTVQLLEARYKQGLTMRQVAKRMGNYSSNICTWEAGTHAPNADHLVRWAHALGFRVVLEPEGQS